MDTANVIEMKPSHSDFISGELEVIARRPKSISETGLGKHFLQELVVKHLSEGGKMNLRQLSGRLALAGPILENILNAMRKDAWIEILGPASDKSGLRYALTDRGRAAAAEALLKSGYIGPAPVPLERYSQVVRMQSVHLQRVTKSNMQNAFADVVVDEDLMDQLGSAVHSGRAIFVYGSPGTGKTYLCQRLALLYQDAVLVPHAIVIDNTVVQVYDPSLHKPVNYLDSEPSMMLGEGFDPRFVLCERPAVVTGGELTLDMLEIQFEPSTRLFQAPLQLKANNGIYIIDDLGRQRVAPVDLFNRWIVPMESWEDYLNLPSGKRLAVPFDVVLTFSTNLNPLELADEAFLRRLGHKIQFHYSTPDLYTKIWQQVCKEKNIDFNSGLLDYVINDLHAKFKVPMLPCHPRDLLGIAQDYSCYQGITELTPEILEIAWNSYFVNLETEASTTETAKSQSDHYQLLSKDY